MEKSKLLLLGIIFSLLIPVWGYGQTPLLVENFDGVTAPQLPVQERIVAESSHDPANPESVFVDDIGWLETKEDLFPPRNLEIVGFPGGGGATLFWEEPEQGEPVAYNIYRDDQMLYTESADELRYDDLTAEIDTTYVYYVTALYENGESGPSNVVEYTPEHGYRLIYASAGENGDIDPEGVIVLMHGDDQDFNIVAHTGYRIDSLLVDNVVVQEAEGMEEYTYSFVNVTDFYDIHVSFALKTNSSDFEAEPKGIKIFPNPTVDMLYVLAGSDFRMDGTVKYTVYDLSGRALLSGSITKVSNRLDISQLGAGIYLLEIQADNRNRTTLKFKKQ